ncbi:unnamed protein product [Plutella xylostella]|uniref:(diamondback moth) hypothetical protein n=1 Tax=Plutella xylostella TaxID=51655 RepID=A0A8S4G4S8_PLUXY|nr:unnamed protein product [Plutella xylostella]
MKLEWTDGEDYGLDEAGFYEGTPPPAPPPRKHVSFSLRLDLCDEGGGRADGIKSEPEEEPRAMQKVPSLSDLTDPEASLGEYHSYLIHYQTAYQHYTTATLALVKL